MLGSLINFPTSDATRHISIIIETQTQAEAQAAAIALAWIVDGQQAEMERLGFSPPVLQDLRVIMRAAAVVIEAAPASEKLNPGRGRF